MALDDPTLNAALDAHLVALAGHLHAELRATGLPPTDVANLCAVYRTEMKAIFLEIVTAAAVRGGAGRRSTDIHLQQDRGPRDG